MPLGTGLARCKTESRAFVGSRLLLTWQWRQSVTFTPNSKSKRGGYYEVPRQSLEPSRSPERLLYHPGPEPFHEFASIRGQRRAFPARIGRARVVGRSQQCLALDQVAKRDRLARFCRSCIGCRER